VPGPVGRTCTPELRHGRTDVVTGFHGSQDLGFRTSINGHWVTAAVFLHSEVHIAAFGSQDLGFRTSINGHWVTAAVFLYSEVHIAAFGSQDLGFRTSMKCILLHLALRTWVSGPRWTAVAVNLRQHRRRQLLRGNGRFGPVTTCLSTTTTRSAKTQNRFCHRKCRGWFCHRIAAELSSDARTQQVILYIRFKRLERG
jgi:hypothetical protein